MPREINYQTLELSPHSAGYIADALEKRIEQLKTQIEAMKVVAKSEGLTTARCDLPPCFWDATKEKIAENIDPWLSWQGELEHYFQKCVEIAQSPLTIEVPE